MTTTTEATVTQQGACEVCEAITSQFDEWSGTYLCSEACERQFFSGYAAALAGMLADESEEEA